MTSKGTKLTLDILECSVTDAGQYALIVTSKKGESKAASEAIDQSGDEKASEGSEKGVEGIEKGGEVIEKAAGDGIDYEYEDFYWPL